MEQKKELTKGDEKSKAKYNISDCFEEWTKHSGRIHIKRNADSLRKCVIQFFGQSRDIRPISDRDINRLGLTKPLSQ